MSEEIIGQVVEGKITNVTNFGAFVKLDNGEEGLIHISEIANEFVSNINDFVKVGDTHQVKVLSRNKKNKLELSLKQASGEPVKPKPVKERPAKLIEKTKNDGFEDKLHMFMKRSEEKHIDIRRNIKQKQGIAKKKKV